MRRVPKIFHRRPCAILSSIQFRLTYLLVHGAWHGAWCWRKVAPLLEARGHTVVTPDLPGHGEDKTPVATVRLEDYTERICQIASAQTEPVILVGHSMGGVVITQAAENCPRQVRALVYMCAFLPRNGESLTSLGRRDAESLLNPNIVRLADGVLGLKPEALHGAFFENCTKEDEAFGRSRLTPQAAAPFGVPVETSADGWGRIPRYYIECSHDRALTPKLQREMQKHSPCQKTFSIDTDHSPFLSAPEKVADILLQIGSL